METMKSWLGAAGAAVGSAVIQCLGGWNPLLQVLVGFMLTDFATGLMVGGLWHKSRKTESGGLDSRAGAKGLARKMLILLFVALGALLDRLTDSHFLRDAVCFFYIGNEGLSILENTAVMGVPYPRSFRNALEILRRKGDGQGDASRDGA